MPILILLLILFALLHPLRALKGVGKLIVIIIMMNVVIVGIYFISTLM